MTIVPFQQSFAREIPDDIVGNSEYLCEVEILRTINNLLVESGLEGAAVEHWLNVAEAEAKRQGKTLSYKQRVGVQNRAIQALRTTILRKYRKVSYRQLSRELALAPLYQWFCKLNDLAEVRIPSKSKLQKDELSFSEMVLRQMDALLLTHAFSDVESLELDTLRDEVEEQYADDVMQRRKEKLKSTQPLQSSLIDDYFDFMRERLTVNKIRQLWSRQAAFEVG